MLVEIQKYKHYLIILAALLIANYVIVPLDEWQENQSLNLELLNAKYEKTQSLLGNQSTLTEQLNQTQQQMTELEEVLFVDSSDDKFKLMAQSLIEKSLTDGKCNIERIGFKGSVVLNSEISRWLMEIRFKGDIHCLVHATRTLESLPITIKISEFNYGHDKLTSEVNGHLSAQILLNVWYKEKSE